MSFTTELQDLRSKIEALIAAGGIIEPALISQLAEINQALDTGGGGGGTPQATIEAAINAATDVEAIKIGITKLRKYTYQNAGTIASRPANTTPYAANQAFGTGTAIQMWSGADLPGEYFVILSLELQSDFAVAGDLALLMTKLAFATPTDGQDASSFIAPAYGFQCIFPSSNWLQIGSKYSNRVELTFPYETWSPNYELDCQLITMEAFTPVASQIVSLTINAVDA